MDDSLMPDDLLQRGVYRLRWLDEHGRPMFAAVDSQGRFLHAMSATTQQERIDAINDLQNLLALFDGEQENGYNK